MQRFKAGYSLINQISLKSPAGQDDLIHGINTASSASLCFLEQRESQTTLTVQTELLSASIRLFLNAEPPEQRQNHHEYNETLRM